MMRFVLLVLLAFIGSAHAQPALVGPCMNNVSAGCSLTAPVIAGATLGGSITGTGATITGGTFSGITLSGTIAGNYTVSGNPTFSGGSIQISTTAVVGSNTTAQTLRLNGPDASGSRIIEIASAGVKRWHWQTDTSNNLQLNAYDASGANPITTLSYANTTGIPTFKTTTIFSAPIQIAPGTVTVAGSDGGTAGTTQNLLMNETLAGSTSASTGFVPNRFLVFDNLAITAQAGATGNPLYRFDFQEGGTAFQGGRSGLQVSLVTNADMPAASNGSTLVAFQPKLTISNNTVGSGGGEAFNPTCGTNSTASGWLAGTTCGEIDWYVQAGAGPQQRVFGLMLSMTEDHGQQGHLMDAMLDFSNALNDGAQTSVGTRNALLIGNAGKNPVNLNNGAILGTMLQTNANTDASAITPMGGIFALDLANFATSEAFARWPGSKLQNGEADHNFLAITQGTNGPILDASVQCVTAATWAAGTGYVQGEQAADRLGGNLTLTTVVAGTPTVLSLANGQGACMKPGEVRTVARGMTIAPTASGGTILNIGALSTVAPGDTVLSPTTSSVQASTKVSSVSGARTFTTNGTSSGAVIPVSSTANVQDGADIEGYGIPGGATIVSHVLNTSITISAAPNVSITSGKTLTQRPYVTLSQVTTGIIPASSPITFTLTGIPSNPVEVIGGTGALGTVNYTWKTATTMQIGASVNTIVGTGSALATNATSGMLLIPSMAGTPTGTVGALGGVALNYDSTNKKLCVTIGATVECSGAFTP